MKKKLWLLLACVWIILLSGNLAWAEFYVISAPSGVGTRISSLPYTITKPGFYYLANDLTSTGNGITINKDNVTIDLMGFSLVGSGTGSLHGININGHSNVEIRNGTVRSFPGDGIRSVLGGSSKTRIINMRLQGNGSRGIHLLNGCQLIQNCNISGNGSCGISLFANVGCMITGNVVCNNGSDGIYATGHGHSLIGNVVANNGGYAFRVSYLYADAPYLIDRNTVYNNTSGTLNGVPPAAEFGINAGPGFP
jgi:hypothetical protein